MPDAWCLIRNLTYFDVGSAAQEENRIGHEARPAHLHRAARHGRPALLAALHRHVRLHPQAGTDQVRRYLDSFDWRLYRAGTTLFASGTARPVQLRWERLSDGTLLHGLTLAAVPRRARDLPPGRFREALEGVLEGRALLPLVDVRCRVHTLRLLNEDQKTTREMASQRIWRLYQKVLRQGRAVRPDSPVEALHRLRLSCKKLRYLLEVFCSLYPARDLDRLRRVLRHLQNNLGDLHDAEAQQQMLLSFARQMKADGAAPVETFLTMGRLADHLEQSQQRARTAFAHCFDRFGRPRNRRRFRRLFHPEPHGARA